jgi:hypothetical protein
MSPLAAEPKSAVPQLATEWLTNSDSDLQGASAFVSAIGGINMNPIKNLSGCPLGIHMRKAA